MITLVVCGDRRQMHRHLAHSDPAEGAGVLLAGAHAVLGRLRIPRFVGHQHRVLPREFIDLEAGDGLPGPLMIEPGPREQVLQSVRSRMSQRLRQRPAVPRVHLQQQPRDQLRGRRPGFAAREAVRDRPHRPPECRAHACSAMAASTATAS